MGHLQGLIQAKRCGAWRFHGNVELSSCLKSFLKSPKENLCRQEIRLCWHIELYYHHFEICDAYQEICFSVQFSGDIIE